MRLKIPKGKKGGENQDLSWPKRGGTFSQNRRKF